MKTAYHKSCMVIILFLIMFMLPISVVQAQQAPEVEWEKTFSGSGHASGFSVQQTTDGGYIIAGETDDSSGNADVYLIKTDASGNKTWEKTFSGSGHASGFSVQQTTDGGYIIAGVTFDSSFSEDVYLIKLKGSGDISASISFLDKEKPSREVNGAAADGVSKVTIQITNLPENITSEKDVLTSINDGDGFLDNDKQISNGVFTQTYIAPEFFVRNGHETEDIALGKREGTLTVSVNGQVEYAPFYLVKPPVVLLHGLWADADKKNEKTWGTLNIKT